MALTRRGRARYNRENERNMSPDKIVVVGARVPLYAVRAMERYIVAFNRDNLGAGMTRSKLMTALLHKFLHEKGLMSPDEPADYPILEG